MKSIILCEGGTDLTLIQYFMEKANSWKYDRQIKILGLNQSKQLKNEENILIIGATGGCSEIPKFFSKTLKSNRNSAIDTEIFNNIIIVTDRDEVRTFEEVKEKISKELEENDIFYQKEIENDKWINCSCLDGKKDLINFRVLLLVIPFEEKGALETFLLDAISKKDSYDKEIITKGNSFVDSIDKEKRYLNKRRYITKAKFDVYFSVRTSAEQFTERKNILRNINWEEYEEIQESFKKLKDLI